MKDEEWLPIVAEAMRSISKVERVESIDGTAYSIADCLPYVVIFAEGDGEQRIMQIWAPHAREAVNVGLKLLEDKHTEIYGGDVPDDDPFDPCVFEVKHIFPGIIGFDVAYDTMRED